MSLVLGRRAFLKSTGAGLALLGLSGCEKGASFPASTLWSAANAFDGTHHLRTTEISGSASRSTQLPVRAHGSALHPAGTHAIAVARRPGTEFFVVDATTGSIEVVVESASQRHYLGHGVFDAEGRYFYATENSYDEATTPDLTPRDSVIGVYEVGQRYRRVAEIPTYGVGAHELLLSPNGSALIIANGGIYTHPSRPREKLNIETMAPSLAYVDVASGALLEQLTLSDHQLGIRHLAVSAETTVVGCQHAGTPNQATPLLYALTPGSARLSPLGGELEDWERFDSYIGSVCSHPDSGIVAATSPLGGVVGFWRSRDLALIAIHEAVDCSGIAAAEDCFLVTTGIGELHVFDAYTMALRGTISSQETRWDNHCIAIPTS